MKTILHAALITLLAICAVANFTGCQSPAAKPTREAVVYYTFADTWTVTHNAYKAHCERVVQGKVSPKDEAEIDAAWNKFRASFKLAFQAASQDWNAATNEDVRRISDELLELLRIL